jgi:hypothetical protein
MNADQLKSLPVYLDGGDGSLWKSREVWDCLLIDGELAKRRFVNVADLLRLLGVQPALPPVTTDPAPAITTPFPGTTKPLGEAGTHPMFWCSTCSRAVDNDEVTHQNTHDRLSGGCGSSLILVP